MQYIHHVGSELLVLYFSNISLNNMGCSGAEQQPGGSRKSSLVFHLSNSHPRKPRFFRFSETLTLFLPWGHPHKILLFLAWECFLLILPGVYSVTISELGKILPLTLPSLASDLIRGAFGIQKTLSLLTTPGFQNLSVLRTQNPIFFSFSFIPTLKIQIIPSNGCL